MRKIVIRWSAMLGAIFIMTAMLTANAFTYKAYALNEEEMAWVEEAGAALQEILAERDVMAVVYLRDVCPVRDAASDTGEILVEIPSGLTVTIQDVVIDDDYRAWVYIDFFYRGTEYRGYIPRANLACSDERFLGWEMDYGMNPGEAAVYTLEAGNDGEPESQTGTGEPKTTLPADIAQFPESYQPALQALKEKHPNWTFAPQHTQLDWKTVIANEIIDGKSLVKYAPDYCKEGAYDDAGWCYASEAILEYYMDPRNFLTEDTIFQFEQLTYNESYHTEAAIESFLAPTFMNGSQNAPGTHMTYPYIIWAIGSENKRKVSPFHLAARIIQEQGVNGGSALISGTYPGYEGYYNHFNIKASGSSTEETIINGLQYAKEKNWKDAYFSILGGSDIIAEKYIQVGQDTIYLQKFNVAPDSQHALYTHQYMQNIAAPSSESKNVKKLYANAGALESTFVFKIPVYQNMPETACAKPTSSNNVVLQVPSGYANDTVYLDGVPYTAARRNGRSIVTAADNQAKSAVVFKYNTNGVATGMYVWTLEYKNGGYVVTAQPELENLLTYHGFSVRITGKSGIRFKTGIDTNLRAKLTSTGVNGFKLKEYGTLVMNHANRGSYPMIKGGQKVSSGMSYGTKADGTKVDTIFATVNGRYHYTSVFVGLPAEQYKTEFAFGGYVTLEKNGVETNIYGPVVAKSIYNLAKQLLDLGTYAPGTEADLFLRKLVADADAVTAGTTPTIEAANAAETTQTIETANAAGTTQ